MERVGGIDRDHAVVAIAADRQRAAVGIAVVGKPDEAATGTGGSGIVHGECAATADDPRQEQVIGARLGGERTSAAVHGQ